MKNKAAIRTPSVVARQITPPLSSGAPWANSSAILGTTLLVDLEDISAVLRTAVLMSRSLNSSLSIDLLEKGFLQIGAGDEISQTSISGLIDSVQSKLRKHGPAKGAVFVLETSITAATFLSAGVISVRIRVTDYAPQRPIIAK